MVTDMSTGVLRSVLTQIDWWWAALFRPRLEGITDAELWWEPVAGAWTLRPGDDGEHRYEWPPGSQGEEPPPFTTLVWRLCHLVYPALAKWALELEGDPDAEAKAYALVFPSTADEAVAVTDECWDRWRGAVGSLTDTDMWRSLQGAGLAIDVPVMRLGAGDPFVNYMLHQHRELIHHGAEICLLRDLYRAQVAPP
jgi:hypothetical protein